MNIVGIFTLAVFSSLLQLGISTKKEPYRFMEDPNLFEGDIRLTPLQKKQFLNNDKNNRYVVKKKVFRPSTSVFRYHIDATLTANKTAYNAIHAAHSELMKYTCVTFVSADPAYATNIYYNYSFISCSAGLGMKDGISQVIKLTPVCFFKQTIMHLILHAFGFEHEHNRPDRDNYIIPVRSNLVRSSYYNTKFKILDKDEVDTYNTPYDYMSIMHPPYNWFSSDPYRRQVPALSPPKGNNLFALSEYDKHVTVKTKDQRYKYEIGQRRGLSFWDQYEINSALTCNRNSKGEFVNGTPGGIPTPAPRNYKPDSKNCYDLSTYCTEWEQRYHRCSTTDERWKSRMNYFCKRTCGICKRSAFSATKFLIHSKKLLQKQLTKRNV